jgi:hypothetical protein
MKGIAQGPVVLVDGQGQLTEVAIDLLHVVTRVRIELLRAARIRRSSSNWLRAPWYGYTRGGALTIGRTIWFTRRYFDPNAEADGSLRGTLRWALLLAHEVGHLPQAARFGQSFCGRVRYVAHFVWHYSKRALLFRRPVHDGVLAEIEADAGRWVLNELLKPEPSSHALLLALHGNDRPTVQAWLASNRERIDALQRHYATTSVERFSSNA